MKHTSEGIQVAHHNAMLRVEAGYDYPPSLADRLSQEVADLQAKLDVALKAFGPLLEIVIRDVQPDGVNADEPDEAPVGWYGNGEPLEMTFGHVRAARTALEKLSEPNTTDEGEG